MNAVDDPWEKQWTFISTLSVKRKIDFLFASSAFGPNSAEAVSSIDLGSDHRAVRTEILIGKCKKRIPEFILGFPQLSLPCSGLPEYYRDSR